MADVVIELPPVDEWGVPTEKMPYCPVCGEDEVGMFAAGRALCYRCRTKFTAHPAPDTEAR